MGARPALRRRRRGAGRPCPCRATTPPTSPGRRSRARADRAGPAASSPTSTTSPTPSPSPRCARRAAGRARVVDVRRRRPWTAWHERALDRLLGARLPGPPEALRRGPFREGRLPSPLHSERRAARVGVWLGVAFLVCFVTGLTQPPHPAPAGMVRLAGVPGLAVPGHPGGARRHRPGRDPAAADQALDGLPEAVRVAAGRLGARVVSRLSILVLVGAARCSWRPA